MPDILKMPNGNTDWSKIGLAIAASVIMILQQWQSYRIAEIKAQGEINKVNFMSKDEIEKRLETLENKFMDREELRLHMQRIDDEIKRVEQWEKEQEKQKENNE